MYITTKLNVNTNHVAIVSVCSDIQDSTSSVLEDIDRHKEKNKDLAVDVRMQSGTYIEIFTRSYFGGKYLEYVYEIGEFARGVDEDEPDEA